jgi:RNA polymerase sigma-70 factor (ECF subfamily)
MNEILDPDRGDSDLHLLGAAMNTAAQEEWFIREVLPLEAMLMQFLRHNWRDKSDIEDLRQEIYVRVCEAAERGTPKSAKSFVFATARNLLIDMARKESVVPIEAVADLESLGIELDAPAPDRSLMAKDELRKLQGALDKLPPRHREAVVLGRIEGLSGREIAQRMGIAETTASQHLKLGMHQLTDLYLRESTDPARRT